MKKVYTLLGLGKTDPKSKYVNEKGKEYEKCKDLLYFPITAYLSSILKEGEAFILYAIDSGHNEHSLRKSDLLKQEIEQYFPGQCDFRYFEADFQSDSKGQVGTFKKLYNTFLEDDPKEKYDIYFDVTFGLRPTPMTIFVACNYADKFLSNIRIKNLIYSQYDHAHPENPQLITDITSLFLLNNLIDTLSELSSTKPMEFIDKVFKLD